MKCRMKVGSSTVLLRLLVSQIVILPSLAPVTSSDFSLSPVIAVTPPTVLPNFARSVTFNDNDDDDDDDDNDDDDKGTFLAG